MTAYYNEIDPYAAQWLRNLIAANLIARGDVDERSIVDVRAGDLAGYGQCHFFAGIGGWSYALRIAEWPDDCRVWTGSCPCQPLSSAGQHKGHADERHLWPAFYSLIAECSPSIVFGEQVASKDGREWLAGVRADLETLGYAVGAADLCAAGVGAPHIRQRLYWVADADGGSKSDSGLQRSRQHGQQPEDGRAGGVGNTDGQPGQFDAREFPSSEAREHGAGVAVDGGLPIRPEYAGAGMDAWSSAVWLPCLDGKARRAEPGIFPLAHGVPGRVGRLRGYGNAIVPQVAAQFISAFAECQP